MMSQDSERTAFQPRRWFLYQINFHFFKARKNGQRSCGQYGRHVQYLSRHNSNKTDFHSNTIGMRNKKQNPMNLSVHDITQTITIILVIY